MIVQIILCALGAISLAIFLIAKCKAYSLKAVAFKALTSMFFIALAAYSTSQCLNRTFPMFIVIALGFGMLGDVFLDLKYVFKEKDFDFTMMGFIAFALGHVCYITGMFSHYYVDQNVLYIILPFVFGLLMAGLCMLIEKPFKLNYAKFKPICFIYAFLLFSMVGTAFSVWMMSDFNSTAMLLVFIGGILFALSDLILNNTYFGEGHERPVDIITNSITYYAAQFIIAFAIIYM